MFKTAVLSYRNTVQMTEELSFSMFVNGRTVCLNLSESRIFSRKFGSKS